MRSSRRDFLKQAAATSLVTFFSPPVASRSAKSYKRIIGANDRINVAIIGLGRRLEAFYEPITMKENNVELVYLCDVKRSQREKAASNFEKLLNYVPKLENDLRNLIDDPKVDAVFNATPDHWHAPGTIMAMEGGKHVYVEKPCSHNLAESEMMILAQQKYNKLVQMGVQQRSSKNTKKIINQIHDGIIGIPYKALTFYTNNRGEVPVQKPSPVSEGFDWELFQGPAPRREYTAETWDYNWHWYGWDYGTAEAGNNGTHEFDIARWALQVDLPVRVDVQAGKDHFINDGWEMYDNMKATFRFKNGKSIEWDGKSRDGYLTYGYDRGTIVYGSEGAVFINRDIYILYDRKGDEISRCEFNTTESGNILGGGGDMSTAHVNNFLSSIRGKELLNAPLELGIISQAMVHYANISYRIGKGFDIDKNTGKIFNRDAMKFYTREYEPGWEPNV